jgi:hypothetical protein
VSHSSLSRFAGPIALAAGGAFVVADLGRFTFVQDDRIAMLADPAFRVFNIAYFFAFPALLIALIAVHGRQARETRGFGTFAFCTAVVGTASLGGDMWFDGFAGPWLAEVAPDVLTAEKTPILLGGAIVSFLLFALGWVLYGWACMRAAVFPAPISILIVLGGVSGFWAGLPPFGIPVGLAVAALGGWLIAGQRTARAERRPLTPGSATAR